MKNKKWIALVMLLGVVIFAACNNSGERGVELSDDEAAYIMQKDSPDRYVKAEEADTADFEAEQKAEHEIIMQQMVIYYSNGQADGLEAETVEAEDITPEFIVGHLAKHNIVSIGTKINRFDAVMEEGKYVLNLDLSKAFGEYIRTMSSSGEAVIMAAVTNTFLEAYGADAIRLTVEGQTLETGHRVYDELLTIQDAALSNT